MTSKRELIPYNYKSMSGHTWSDLQVDSYNAVQARINSFISDGLPVPDYLIYSSFNLFTSIDRGLTNQEGQL